MKTAVGIMGTGALGLNDVALSLPTVVGPDGAMEVVVPRMDARERAGVEHSAECYGLRSRPSETRTTQRNSSYRRERAFDAC